MNSQLKQSDLKSLNDMTSIGCDHKLLWELCGCPKYVYIAGTQFTTVSDFQLRDTIFGIPLHITTDIPEDYILLATSNNEIVHVFQLLGDVLNEVRVEDIKFSLNLNKDVFN